MKPIKRIVIDLNRPRTNTVQLVQGDTARQIAVVLMLDGMPYDVSADTSDTIVMGVAYIKANGVDGYYEETTTGDDAVTAGDNDYTWIVSLDNHATDVPGLGAIFIRFSTADGLILHSFPVKLFIDRSSASGGTDPNAPYYQTNSFLIAGNQATKTAAMTTPIGVDSNGKLWVEASQSAGLTQAIKDALLACFQNVAWADSESGLTCYEALEEALGSTAELVSIEATFTQGSAVVYESDTLDSLKPMLVVVANYDDSTSAPVITYTLSGSLTVGTSTITVTYGEFTDTFTVTVTADPVPYLYNWDLTQSLVDSVQGQTIVLRSASGADDPTRDENGLVFDEATQVAYLGQISLAGKTIEFDVASFAFAGSTNYHIRFLMAQPAENYSRGYGAIIWKKDAGWTCYGTTTDAQSGTRVWDAGQYISGTSSEVINAFNGKTVKLVCSSDGHTRSLYLDNVLQATLDDVYVYDYLSIGGVAENMAQSSGDQCYNMTITGIRIYENEV